MFTIPLFADLRELPAMNSVLACARKFQQAGL
jgi:hypothetical protein